MPRWLTWAGGALLAVALVACEPFAIATATDPASQDAAETPMTPPGQRPDVPCPKMSSDLNQLLAAPDPAAFAAQRGLHYAEDRVRVEIQLQAAEGELADEHQLQVEARYRSSVQALALLSTLCDLSNDPRVLFVQSPIQASPATPG